MPDIQPAQLTSLGVQGHGFVPGMTAPDRGLDLRSGVLRTPKDCAKRLQNLRWNGVAWTTEEMGYTRHRATVFNAGGAFKEFAVHNTNDGVAHFLQQVGTQVQAYDPLGNPLTTVEAVLFTAASESIPCMRSYSATKFLYVNGVDVPQTWDGAAASFSAMTGWPKVVGSDTYNTPKLVETFQGRAAYAGFGVLPYHVLISQFGDPAGFDLIGGGATDPARAGIIKVPSGYGPIVTLKSFRISAATNEEILLIGCRKGFLFVGGIDANSFITIQSSRKYGFVSNRCWMKLDDTAFALCTDGLRPFAGNINTSNLEGALISAPVQKLIKRMATDQNQLAQAFVIDNAQTQEAIFYFPSGSDVHNKTALIMNYVDVSSGLIRLSEKRYPKETGDPQTYHAPSCGIEFEGKYLCGGYNGYLQVHWNGNKFNQTGIDAVYQSPLVDSPTPSQTASSRGVWIECEGPSQSFTVTGSHYDTRALGNLKRVSAPQKTFTSDLSGSTIIGQWVIGQSAFGGVQRQQFEYDPRGAGKGWEITMTCNTANGDLSLVGIFTTLIGGGTRG